MLNDYSDIKSRLGEPLWYDMYGVPRYELFDPGLCGVYPTHIAFMIIACQACNRHFKVAEEISQTDHMIDWYMRHGENAGEPPPLALPTKEDIGTFHYGDPPPHGDEPGRCSGETMNCETVRVLQFWRRDNPEHTWVRDSDHEVAITLPGDES